MYVIRFLARRIGGAHLESEGIAKSNSTEVRLNSKILTRERSRSNTEPVNGWEKTPVIWPLRADLGD
jgi:hypothetical protein